MKSNQTYPYQNLSLTDIDGEQWEDVPGFYGAYQVSSYGRIKSLKRWRNSGIRGGYYSKECIRKPGVSISPNEHTGMPTYHLGINLKQDGRSLSVSVAKLVYYCFVEPFDLDDPDVIVYCKDYDGRNVRPDNLVLTSRSETMLRAYEEHRAFSHWQETYVPVLQLDMKGKMLARYDSLTEAADQTGFSLTAIRECILGHIYQHKECRWRAANERQAASTKEKKVAIFNEYLWEKLGRPKTSKRAPLPVFNLSLETLISERWKPIEGLHGAYYVSNLGRVKSAGRFKSNGVWLKEHVQRLIPDGSAHRPTSSLLVQLSKEGKKHQQSVARLVYYHFVEKFDLHDKSKKIGCKNRCFYDLSSINLELK